MQGAAGAAADDVRTSVVGIWLDRLEELPQLGLALMRGERVGELHGRAERDGTIHKALPREVAD